MMWRLRQSRTVHAMMSRKWRRKEYGKRSGWGASPCWWPMPSCFYHPPLASHYESIKGFIDWLGQISYDIMKLWLDFYDLIYHGNVLIDRDALCQSIYLLNQVERKVNHTLLFITTLEYNYYKQWGLLMKWEVNIKPMTIQPLSLSWKSLNFIIK